MTGRRATARWLLLAVALVLGACAELPRLTPELARSHQAAPLLVGPAGPLSARQSKTVVDALEHRSPDTDIFAHHLAREEAIVSSPMTTGNAVRLLLNGAATYEAMLTAMGSAVDHINLETYIFDDDEVGQRFAQTLIAKQRQGVQVNLVRDSVGTLGTPLAFFDALAASGIAVLEFNPVNPLQVRTGWELNQRDHRKLLIVDGHTAFLGGINISSVYSTGSFSRSARRHTGPGQRPGADTAWRDTDLQLQGPVVAELQKLFLAAWVQQQGPPLAARDYFPSPVVAGKEVVRAIGSSPEEAYSQIYATLLSAISSAETSVQITNAYFAPDPQLLAALKAAAARGVEVVLILPGQTDSWLVFHAGRGHYEELLSAGVKIFERRGVVLHSKTALIDGVWATIGSTNLDWRSFLHNHELNAVVLGADFGRQVGAMFDADLAASDPILLPAWQARALDLRLREWFARWWEYWL